ncbi:MAG: imidazole glycerol phosphate synthase subunit HisF [Thermoplasmata archaeon]|jgi:cyclase|nr:imidazole glycerol phosphate synthase subunit HisF [Candidatus Sysuiplasma jiujiangense]
MKRIIPCLDILGDGVVKGVQFRGLKNAGDPVELSSRYEKEGADEIAWLDIGATNSSRETMFDRLRDTASVLFIPLTAGGGLRSLEDVSRALGSGADKISLNTAAVKNPDLVREVSEEFGSQCVVVSVDAAWNSRAHRYEVFTNSGTVASGMDAIAWSRRVQDLGAGEILLTSRDADGTGRGYDERLVSAVTSSLTIPVIASGGCGSIGDFIGVLGKCGADAALAASVFHFGTLSIGQVKRTLLSSGIEVRRSGGVEAE